MQQRRLAKSSACSHLTSVYTLPARLVSPTVCLWTVFTLVLKTEQAYYLRLCYQYNPSSAHSQVISVPNSEQPMRIILGSSLNTNVITPGDYRRIIRPNTMIYNG